MRVIKAPCRGLFQRHWFAYRGSVGSSSPVCIRCGIDNPNYDPNRDIKR